MSTVYRVRFSGGKVRDVLLEPPTSVTFMIEVVQFGEDPETSLRAGFAALGMCWRGIGRPKGARFRGRILAYGGDVLDELLASGANLADCTTVALAAMRLCLASMPSLQEAAVAEDFTGTGSTPDPASTGPGEAEPASATP
jgi:hypothetical protein